MPTTQTSMRIPPLRNSSLDTVIQQWLLADGLRIPLRTVDTTSGSYTEALPSAGVFGNSGETNQNQEITFVKVSADGNTFSVTGAVGGTKTISTQYGILRFKSDGTNWWQVGSSAAGSGLALQTNGVANGSQALLNLFAGAGVTLSDNGSGTVKISAVGTPLTLETNGAANSSQTLLNLIAGAGLALSESGGGVTFSELGFSIAGQGGFFGPGLVGWSGWTVNNSVNIVTNANEVRVTQFVLDRPWTIRKVSVRITGGSNGKLGWFGIYSPDGLSKLVDSGTFTISANPQNLSNTLAAPVALSPGAYWFAQSANDPVNFSIPGITTSASLVDTYNLNATRAGVAANGTGGTGLPMTLGAITPATDATTNITTWTALPFFEP